MKNSLDKIYQSILDYAINEGSKASANYWKAHENEESWSVGFGDVYVIGNSGFAKWYRRKMKTRTHKVAIAEGGGYKFEGALLWAQAIQNAFSEFGVETINDVHLD